MHSRSVTKSCVTVCDPMCYSPPSSSVHGIFQFWTTLKNAMVNIINTYFGTNVDALVLSIFPKSAVVGL